jgi:gamma-glutamylcyclotransferase (GGCT)/AIG2-like uncharacterized protein YtfP
MAPPAQSPRRRERELTSKLFVYGTLMPTHDAWPVLERWSVGSPRPDAVAGVLFDTGRGYPCATFGGSEIVHGVVVDLDPIRLVEALAALDAYEASEYDRIVVATMAGEQAHTYAWVASLDHCQPVAGGRWRG